MKLKAILNEISVKAGLTDILKGRTSAIEGIKMSKELVHGITSWIASSPYGMKYGKQILKGRIHSMIGPADAMGIERYLKGPASKKEWKQIVKKYKPKRESVDEAAPRIRKDVYVEKLRLLYKDIAKLDNQMKSADSSRYSHVKKDFNKALKAVAELTNTLNRKGATIPN
jgi:hypothetical protein